MANLMDRMGSLTAKVKQMSQNVTAQVRERVVSNHPMLPDHLNTEETDLLYSHYTQLGQAIQTLNTQIRDSIAAIQKFSNLNRDVASLMHEQATHIQKVDITQGTEKLSNIQSTVSNAIVNDLMNAIEVQLLRPFVREQQADQDTKRILQEAFSTDQVVEHLTVRIDRRETVLAQATLAYIEIQNSFFRDITNLFVDISSLVAPLSEKVKKAGKPTENAKASTPTPKNAAPVAKNTSPAPSSASTSPVLKQTSAAPKQTTSPVVPKQTAPAVPPAQPRIFNTSTNDLLGDFGSPSTPKATLATNNAPSLFDFGDAPSASANGSKPTSYSTGASPDFFGSPTLTPQTGNFDIFANPPASRNISATQRPSPFDDLATLQTPMPTANSPLPTPLQASTPKPSHPTVNPKNDDPFAMFGVPTKPSSSAPPNSTQGGNVSAPAANPTVISTGVHPSFYNDHEEDKAKVKVIDKRPKQAVDEQSVQQRIEDQISELRERENKKEWESEARRELDTTLTARIENWAGGRKGNLRSLISTLHLVLWEDCGWKESPMANLIDPSKLKLAYRKALLIVHPDKQTDKPLEQRFIAERVFELLTEAYKNEESIH